MRIKCWRQCVWLCVSALQKQMRSHEWEHEEERPVHRRSWVALWLHVHLNIWRDCAAANLPYRPLCNTHSHTCCDGCWAPAELSSRPQLPLCHYAIWQLQMVWELHARILLFHPAWPSYHEDKGVWQQLKDPSGTVYIYSSQVKLQIWGAFIFHRLMHLRNRYYSFLFYIQYFSCVISNVILQNIQTLTCKN